MSDVFTRDKRTTIMRAVRGKNTKPEYAVRRALHALGYRFRLHVSELPGTPDLVFSARRCVVFIHGCFWHRHSCRKGRSRPTTRADFWERKLAGNQRRDAKTRRKLHRLSWSVVTIWECQLTPRRFERTIRRITRRLERAGR